MPTREQLAQEIQANILTHDKTHRLIRGSIILDLVTLTSFIAMKLAEIYAPQLKEDVTIFGLSTALGAIGLHMRDKFIRAMTLKKAKNQRRSHPQIFHSALGEIEDTLSGGTMENLVKRAYLDK